MKILAGLLLVGMGVPGAFLFAADQVPTPDSPMSWITSGGVMGILAFVVMAFLREWIVPGNRYRTCEAETREMQKFMREEAIPLLSRVQDVLIKQMEKEQWDERLSRRQNPE